MTEPECEVTVRTPLTSATDPPIPLRAIIESAMAGIGERKIPHSIDAALVGVCVLGLLLTGFLVARAGIDPLPWIDEVSYADPFLNAVDGRGLTSGSWAGQPYGQLWASNSPLYGLIAMPALQVFGTNAEAWRGLWSAVYVALTAIFVRSLAGLGLVRNAFNVFLGGATLLTAPCMFFLVTCGRGIDVTCIAVIVAAVAALAFLRGTSKAVGVFMAGFLMPWAGIQLIPAASAVLACCLIANRRKTFSVGVLLAVGAAIGLVALFGVLAVLGVFKVFVSQTFASGFTSVGSVAQSLLIPNAKRLSADRFDVFQGMLHFYYAGPEVVAIAIAAVVNSLTALTFWRQRPFSTWTVCCVVAGLVAVPCFMVLAGRWVYYYFWMAFLPLQAAALCEPHEHAGKGRRFQPFHALMLAVVCSVCVFSSYAPAAMVRHDKMNRLGAALDGLMGRTARPDDVALVDFCVYFRYRPCVSRIYTPSYGGGKLLPSISAAEQEQMTLIVVQRKDASKIVGDKIKGHWVECDREPMAEFGLDDIVVFRRENNAP